MRHFEIEYSDGQRYLAHEISEDELDEARKYGPIVSLTDEEYEEFQAHNRRHYAYQDKWKTIDNEWWAIYKK